MRRILYISGEPNSPGDTYRVKRYMECAKFCGWSPDSITLGDIGSDLLENNKYDVVVLWRTAWNVHLGSFLLGLRENGVKIVFDVDDLMFIPDLAKVNIIDGIRSQGLRECDVAKHYSMMLKSLLSADYCFAATEEIAFYMRLLGKPTFVLKNGFSLETHIASRLALRKKLSRQNDGLLRIGYASGSLTHQRDFRVVAAPLCEVLSKRPYCRLVLFKGVFNLDEFPELKKFECQVEWRDRCHLNQLPEEIARFDINIAPLEFGNPYCESKSELKFFEAALADVPTIASPTEPFRKAIKHGETGLLAASFNEWLLYLNRLLDDEIMRKTMGRSAYFSALANYGTQSRIVEYGNTLEQLFRGNAATRAFALAAKLSAISANSPVVYPSEVLFEKDNLEKALVTVVVALYNYEQFIIQALDSVKEQSIKILDLVIVDGGSTDSSLVNAIKWTSANHKRFNRLVVLRNNENYGLALCRNTGFAASETPYILPLDADNQLNPECCEKLLSQALETGAAFVYPVLQQFGTHNGLMGTLPFDPQHFVFDNFIDAMALISKEAWACVGGYDHVKGGWEDYHLWCKFTEAAMLGVQCPEVLAKYRCHQQSMRMLLTVKKSTSQYLVKKLTELHPWVSPRIKKEVSMAISPIVSVQSSNVVNNYRQLDRILPILRCPISHCKLIYDSKHGRLVSYDGLNTWRLFKNHPIFLQDIKNLEVKPDSHISNSIANEALEIIQNAKGLVLNLSAGGTKERFENVIEVEYALFRNTDVVADAHSIPFDDNVFESIICQNAFEHYKNPERVIQELHRVLKPGGILFVRTAFLQPLHEAPYHYYNATRYGLEEWMKSFDPIELSVSNNFAPNHTLSWLASEAENAFRKDISNKSAQELRDATVGQLIDCWRDEKQRNIPLWTNFFKLSEESKSTFSAGFQFIGKKRTTTFKPDQ
jgi:glycosyltransferase involved in cell wall biosynthesis